MDALTHQLAKALYDLNRENRINVRPKSRGENTALAQSLVVLAQYERACGREKPAACKHDMTETRGPITRCALCGEAI